MSILVTNESYNTLGSLYANAGDWVDCTFEFNTRFYAGSGVSAPFTYINTGNQFYITSNSVNWGERGFIAGDSLNISFTYASSGVTITFIKTVDYTTGNNLFLTTSLGTIASGTVFPTNGVINGMAILADKLPNSISVDINLAPNGTTTTASVIDGSTNRLEYSTVNTMSAGTPVDMVQLGNKSGGLIKDVQLEYIAGGTDGYKDFKITYKLFQWGVIKDGFAEPNYYDNTECLAPLIKVSAFALYGNPNGVLTATSQNTEANTGGFNENFNGGVNNYTTNSISWTDTLGNTIDAMDYSGQSNFVATISQTIQSTTLSKYRIGLLFRPVDGDIYQNLTTNLGNNLLLNAPEVDFLHSTSPSATVYAGYTNSSGVAFGLTNLQFTQSSGTLTVSGTVQPNTAAINYFNNFPNGERLMTMWVSLSDHTTTNQFSDKVSLQIFNADNIDAPVKGVQIPNVVSETLLDHNNNNITASSLPNTVTEDDVLYKSDFRLLDNLNYSGVRAKISAYNTLTQEIFTLEEYFFSFANTVNINGQFQPNFNIPRGFNLPPTSDRNAIKLLRKPSLDVTGKYGLELSYGFLNDWRYWLAQSGVNDDFFDITQPNNGLNKNWQHYNTGNWVIAISYHTLLNDVEDFNIYISGIKPYDSQGNLTTVNTYKLESNNQTVTNLLDDDVHILSTVSTWTYNFLNAWAEVTIEDKEAGNRWVISSVLDQGNITANPLKPLIGSTKLEGNILGNVATYKCKIDTNYVDATDVCLTTRIYSDANAGGQILHVSGEAEVAYSVRRVASTTVYNGNCLRVRRPSDDAELDIGFVSDELDTTSLLTFVGSEKAFVSVFYDQSGNGNNAIMTSQQAQPLIADGGSVIVASNGKPALQLDGVNDFLSLTTPLQVGQLFYESFVFERLTASVTTVSLGTSLSTNPFVFQWSAGNRLESAMCQTGINTHASSQTQSGDFLATTRREADTDSVSMRLNGASVGSSTYTVGLPSTLITIGTQKAATTVFMTGKFQELIYFNLDKSSSQVYIETNTNGYYNLY